jgi:hypothetical protein
MRTGHVDVVSRTLITGWAADADAPNRRLDLCVVVNGREIARVTADRPRKDLAKLGKFGDGAHGFRFGFAEPLPFDRDYTITIRFADDGATLPNGKRLLPGEPGLAVEQPAEAHVPRAAADPGRPAPILVTAPGRSGTTYLMSCLAASPQIVVAELVPYEVRLLSYYANALTVLSSPGDMERSTHPDRLEGDGFHIGFNPFNGPQHNAAFHRQATVWELFEAWAPERFGQVMAEVVTEYYRRLATDRNKPLVRFFAEKNDNLRAAPRRFMRRLFPERREIVIVRDPRDVLCSQMAYFGSNHEKGFNQISYSCRQLKNIHEAAGADTCFITYEEMVRGDRDMFARLSSFLDAEVKPVNANTDMFQKHATSASPEASIGRWLKDLPEALRQRTVVEWGDFLKTFGYDTLPSAGVVPHPGPRPGINPLLPDSSLGDTVIPLNRPAAARR